MPDQPKTPHHTFRAPEKLWQAAQKKAAAEGRTVTDVLIDALTKYVRSKPKK